MRYRHLLLLSALVDILIVLIYVDKVRQYGIGWLSACCIIGWTISAIVNVTYYIEERIEEKKGKNVDKLPKM